jgi:hypothetical protein
MATLGDIVINLRMSSRGVTRSTKKARSGLRGMREESDTSSVSLRRLQSAMGGVVALAGGLAIKFGIGLAAEAETARVSFETMLGSADLARRTLEDLEKFAASTPFELAGLRDAAKTLLAFGTSQGEVINDLRRLGDVSALSGKSLGELSTLYGKARINQRLFGDDVTRFAEAGIPIYDELTERFGVTGAALKKIVENGGATFEVLEAALIRATSKGGKFADGMKRQSQTLAGVWSTLKDNVTARMRDVGAELADALDIKNRATSLIEFVSSLRTPILGLVRGIRKFVGEHPRLFAMAGGFLAIFAAVKTAAFAVKGLGLGIGLLNAHPLVLAFSALSIVLIDLIGHGDTFGEKMGDVLKKLVGGIRQIRDNFEQLQASMAGVSLNEFRRSFKVGGLDMDKYRADLAEMMGTAKGFRSVLAGMLAGQQNEGFVIGALSDIAPGVAVEQLEKLFGQFKTGTLTADDLAASISQLAAETDKAGKIAGRISLTLTDAEKSGNSADRAAAGLSAWTARVIELKNANAAGAVTQEQFNIAKRAQIEAYDKLTGGASAYIAKLKTELELLGKTAEQQKLITLQAAGADAKDLNMVADLQAQLAAKSKLIAIADEQKTKDEQALERIAELKRELGTVNSEIGIGIKPVSLPDIEPPSIKPVSLPDIEPPSIKPVSLPDIEPPNIKVPEIELDSRLLDITPRDFVLSNAAVDVVEPPPELPVNNLAEQTRQLEQQLGIRNSILDSQRRLAEALHGAENVRLAKVFDVDVGKLAEATNLVDLDKFDIASRLGLGVDKAGELLEILNNQKQIELANGEGPDKKTETKSNSAALVGSGEVYSRILSAMKQNEDPAVKEAKKQTKATNDVVAAVKDVKTSIEENAGELIA